VTGTGGGTSIRNPEHIFIAPSGVQKERIQPSDIFVLDAASKAYVRRPPVLKPSACTPLFLAAYTKRNAGCCIHTHSQWAVLVTLLVEREFGADACFEIEELEQIKGVGRWSAPGEAKKPHLGYFDRLRIPIIENTAQ
jgi:methylthioribulose-1-phosphate dehydratase